MGGYAALAVLFLAGFSALWDAWSWAYLLFLAVFEIWLMRRVGGVGRGPVAGVARAGRRCVDRRPR